MRDALGLAKHRLAIGLDREPPIVEPLIADQWVVKSLLQKSIRRGEVDIAQRAALTFLAQKGSAIWRRFIVIAFEDIGAGSVDVVAQTVAASTDTSWRKQSGGDDVVASHLARLLAEAPKSRADLLKVGVPAEQIEPLLQLFRGNIQHLNELRVHTLCKKRGLFDVATVLMTDEEG
jgi:hypothetical protein